MYISVVENAPYYRELSPNNHKENITMSKIKEKIASLPALNTATPESDNQSKYIMNVSFITKRFQGNKDINFYIFSIARYMHEHLEELNSIHSLLFIALGNLKDSLLALIDERQGKDLVVINYILSHIQSVLDNPSSIEEDKEHLLDILRACIGAIRSKNNLKRDKIKTEIDDLKAKLARHDVVEKEIVLALYG